MLRADDGCGAASVGTAAVPLGAAASPFGAAAVPLGAAAAAPPTSFAAMPTGSVAATPPSPPPPGAAAAAPPREYHSCDFPWEELAPVGRAWEARHARADRAAEADALAAAAAAHWQRFHRRNATGRFFKPRHYVPRAFPALAALGPRAHVLELGAGNGSNATLLDALPAVVHFSDVAGAALAAVAAHPLVAAGVAAARATLFAWDVVTGAAPAGLTSPPRAGGDGAGRPRVGGGDGGGSDSGGDSSYGSGGGDSDNSGSADSSGGRGRGGGRLLAQQQLAQWGGLPPAQLAGGMDWTLCMFVLSALHPRHHGTALRHALGTLKPGGTLAFRDYGLYDHAQLRAGPDSVLTPRLHVRGDGTLAYYFSVEEVRALLEDAGYVVLEADYVTIRAVNRKKGVTLHRVWVHARATRPAAG